MKREYSFKDSSRLGSAMQEPENRLSYGSNKMARDSWTDLRVEEIKRKYDTPSHRKNLSQLTNNDRSRDNFNDASTPSKYLLRDSVAHNVNRAEPQRQHYRDEYTPQSKLRNEEESPMPTFSVQSKENAMFQKFSHIKNCLKNDLGSNSHKEYSNYRDYPRTKVDPRVQNIDKINSKIKKILNCLHENESYMKKQRPELTSSFLKGSVISRGNHSEKEEMEETKILSRQKVSGREANLKTSMLPDYEKDLSFSPKNKDRFENEAVSEEKVFIKNSASYFKENHDSKYNSPYKQLVEPGKSGQDSWFETKIDHNRNRARSCLGDFPKDQFRLSSGKKLDDEISRTTNRIKALEEQKKQLNIQFKPYHYELRANRSTSNLNSKTNRSSKPPLPKMKASEFSGQNYRRNYAEKSRTEANQERPYQKPRSSMFEDSEFKKIDLPRQSNVFVTQNSNNSDASAERSARFAGEKSKDPSVDEVTQDNQNQEQREVDETLKHQAEEGIENRKRRLLDTATVSFARETKSLIENLFDQVKLDEQFRDCKIWFRDLFNADKWEELKRAVHKMGGREDCQSLMKVMEVTEEEDNPFFSNRGSEMDMEALVKVWRECEKHWDERIRNQFDPREFEKEQFYIGKIDLERKGHFTVEDLVRFLNMETGTFYRNRDLILIFKRFTKGSQLEWEEFMRVLDKNEA